MSEAERLAFLETARQGDESTVPVVRKLFANSAAVVDLLGNVPSQVTNAWIGRHAGRDVLAREAIAAKVRELTTSLLQAGASPTERLLVDRVVACWLQVNLFDGHEARAEGRSFKQAEFDLKRQESAQRRFLRAVRTLAEVRRLLLPTVQLNVAENQINLASSVTE